MLMGARNLCKRREYVKALDETGDALKKAVEAGKKQFVGFELPGKTLGVIGLGAIGVEVANAALDLGMKVVGYDPAITVRNAWQLSSGVEQEETLDQLFQHADFVTCHVPLIDATRNMVNADRIALMNDGGVLINFARGGIVDDAAAIAALDSGKLHAFVTDFPTPELIAHPKVYRVAASWRFDRRGRRELRDHGGGERQGLPGERQYSLLGQLPAGALAATGCLAHHRCERKRAEHGRPDFDVHRECRAQYRRPAEQVGRRVAYTIVDVNGEPSDALLDELRCD